MKRAPVTAKGSAAVGQPHNARRGSQASANGVHASPSPAGSRPTKRTSPSPLPQNPSTGRDMHPTNSGHSPTTRTSSTTRHPPSVPATTPAGPSAPPPPMPVSAADHEIVAIATYMDVVATSIAHRTKSIANPPVLQPPSSYASTALQRIGPGSSSLPDLLRPQHPHGALSPLDGRSRAGTLNNSPVDGSQCGREVELAPSGRTSVWSDVPGLRTSSPPPTSCCSESTSTSLQPTTSSSDLFRLQRASILEKVQLFGNGLLHWYGTLETKRLPEDTTIDAVGHNIAVLSKNLHQAINDCLARCEALCSTGGTPAANETLWRYYKSLFDDCFTNLGQMTAAAKTLVLMRRLVASRDAERVAALLQELKAPTHSGGRGGARSGQGAGQAAVFVQWVERQWLPAIREWDSVVSRARNDVEAAGGTAAAAERAIAATHREVASRSASIREILLPGETVEQLLQDGVEKDLKALGSRLEAQHQAMADLRQAVATVDFMQLATCLRAASAYAPSLTRAQDKETIASAEKLLIDVQLVAKVTVGLSLALKAREPKQLLRAILAANDTMAALRICSSAVSMQTAQARGKAWLAQLEAMSGLDSADAAAAALAAAAETLPTNVLHVEHVPTRAWAPELSIMYQRACGMLDDMLLRLCLERRLSRQLALFRGAADNEASSDGGCTGRMSVDELKRLVEQCKEVGVQGPVLDAAEQFALRAETIRVKVHFDSRIRVVVMDQAQAAASFRYVHARVVGVCPPPATSSSASTAPPTLRIRYQDSDGDFVSLLDDADWQAVYSDMVARQQQGSTSGASGGSGLKLEVFCDYALLPVLHSPPGSSSGVAASGAARLSNVAGGGVTPQPHSHAPSSRNRQNTPTHASGSSGSPMPESTGLRVDGVSMGGVCKPVSPPPPPPPPVVVSSSNANGGLTDNGPSPAAPPVAAEPQPPPLSERRGSSPRGPIYDAHRAQTVRQTNDASPLAIRIAKDNVSKWESAAAEALELLTVASMETQSARTSLARDAQLPSAGQGANRRTTAPGRWADTSDVDTAEIQTIASVDPQTAPQQRPPSAGHPGAPVNSREKSVMMLAQLRKQKQALETASRASQGKVSGGGAPLTGQGGGVGSAPHRR